MKRYTALIEIGWVKKNFEGNTPLEIVKEVEKIQDFDCLMMMGRAEEDKKGQIELDKLEAFLKKYYNHTLTIEDLKSLEIHLSLGNLICHELVVSKN